MHRTLFLEPDDRPDAPLSTGPGLANPRTVPVTASTPLAVAAGAMLPANNATGVPIDTLLRIGFDAPPTLGTSGIIAIHLASNGAIVDSINVADTYAIYSGGSLTSASLNTSRVNIIGNVAGAGVSQVRVVNYVPIFVDGNTVTIVPHNNKLAYNTAYYVTIDNGLIAGTISATTFTGIAAPTGWTFTTKAVAPTTLNVAADNSADFATVQGAIDSFAPGSTARTINIAPGVYQEMLFLRSKNNVTFKGTNNGLDAVIQYDNSDPFNPGVGQGQGVPLPGLGTTTGALDRWRPFGAPHLQRQRRGLRRHHHQEPARPGQPHPAAAQQPDLHGLHAQLSGRGDLLQCQPDRNTRRQAQQLHQLPGHVAVEGRQLVLRLLHHR